MKYEIIYYFLILLLGLSSLFIFLSILNEKETNGDMVRFKKNRYKEFTDFVEQQLDSKELNETFRESGLKITALQYNIIRFLILFIWLGALVYQLMCIYKLSTFQIVLWFVFYIFTCPRENIGNKSLPFHQILKLFITRRKEKQEKEIYRAISQLKNLTMSKVTEDVSATWIIEQLMKFTQSTKPVFNKMLSLWYESKQIEACEYLEQKIGTAGSKELSNILLKLDQGLGANELKEQLNLYQSNIKAERRTKSNKKNLTRSNGLYALVITSAFFVVLNFVVVVILIDSIAIYKNIHI